MSPGVNRSSPTEACRAQLCIPCWHVGPCAMIRPERGCDGTNISSASPDGLFCCLFRAVSTSLLPIINLCCLPCSLSYSFPVLSASLLRSRTLSHGHSPPPLPLHLFINTRASKTFHRMHSSLPLVLALPVIRPPVPPTSTAMHVISAPPTSPRSSPPPPTSPPLLPPPATLLSLCLPLHCSIPALTVLMLPRTCMSALYVSRLGISSNTTGSASAVEKHRSTPCLCRVLRSRMQHTSAYSTIYHDIPHDIPHDTHDETR